MEDILNEDVFEDNLEQCEAKRKLATVQIIDKLYPIDGADRIVLAIFKNVGWRVVVGKNSFKEGDKCIYCEIDSVLPIEHFPELEKCDGRIRTIRLKGQISQGYCIPITEAMKIAKNFVKCVDGYSLSWFVSHDEGTDWTTNLGITKYIKKVSNKGKNGLNLGRTTGNFPSHLISKTDEERVQGCKKELGIIQEKQFFITLKCDGSSCTFGWEDDNFWLASRNQKKEYNVESCSFAKAISKYGIKDLYENDIMIRNYIMQGEVCGKGIQGNKLCLDDIDIFIFNIFDVESKKMLDYTEQQKIANIYGFKLVPLVESGVSFSHTIDSLQTLSQGFYDGTKNHREGIVIRSYGDEYMKYYGNYISFKMINEKFLLSEE